MARAIATREAVFAVADAIRAEGGEPTVILVQARIGGGSYTTTKRLLDEWEAVQTSKPTAVVELPVEIATRAEEAVRALWLSATALAQRSAQVVADQALADATQARRELDEALAEVQRLERVEAELTQALDAERARGHELELRAAALAAEAKRVAALEAELDTVRREQSDTSDLRAVIGELQRQVAELVSSTPARKGVSKAT